MKAWCGVWGFFFVLCFAAGNAASALEARQPEAVSRGTGTKDVVSRATGTKTASEEFRVILRVPVMSPLFSQVPIAVVNDEPIRMEDLTKALSSLHKGADPTKNPGKIEYDKILDRLINVKLAIQEANNIGLNELPEFKSALDDFTYQALALVLTKEATKDTKADPEAVEKRYKDIVVEWKLRSLFFEKEEDAKAMAAALKAGKSFDELAEKVIAEKKATAEKEGSFMKPKDLLPVIASEVSTLGTGSVSHIIRVQDGKKQGFTILKLEDKRYPDSPEAREQAEQSVLFEQRSEAAREYIKTLYKKYVKVQERRLRKLDYESPKTNLDELFADTRALAEIKGEKPITVGDLTEALNKKYYHGLDKAAGEKKVNQDKVPLLYSQIDRRVITKEALEKGLDKSEEYQNRLKEFKNATLFGMFVERAVAPGIEVKESDLKAYYEAHQKEYAYPEMMKLTSLVFGSKPDAESALKALRTGTDIDWARANASGLVATADDDPLFLNARVLTMNALPDDMRTVLAGARMGDYRLYGEPGGRYYVLFVQEVIPSRLQTYQEARESLVKPVSEKKIKEGIEDWFQKLRAGSDIKVYLDSAK